MFLREMQNNVGWEVYGVEINEFAACVAREQHWLDVRVGTLEQAAFPDEFFDAVTLWDVLEHLHDPVASLREIRRILKLDGVLVIRVPNANSWDAALFGRYWAGLEPPRHLYVFTPNTLGALLTANSFRAKSWSSNIAAYTTFLLSLRLWSNAQKRPNAARDFLIRSLHHPLMRLLVAPVFYLDGIGLRGPLMVVTAFKGETFSDLYARKR
jgi:SAM-dependent methyltransferase